MENRTKRDEKGTAWLPGIPQMRGLKAVEELAQYCETGLTPGEIKLMKEELAKYKKTATPEYKQQKNLKETEKHRDFIHEKARELIRKDLKGE